MAHWPVWGSDVFIETNLGVVLGLAYHASDNNLGVPIAIHTLYDFTTHLTNWHMMKKELTDRMTSGIAHATTGKQDNELKKLEDFTLVELDRL